MNCGDEQKNELEALSEIYFNEIKIISAEQPISFSIKIRPQASSFDENLQQENNNNSDGENDQDSDDDDDDEDDYDDDDEDDDDGTSGQVDNNIQKQSVFIELKFDLPPKYPDEKPSIQILDSQNINQDELSTLMEMLSEKSEESLGTVMVFMLVSDVVEWLITKTEQNEAEIEQEQSAKKKELEAEEQKRFEGTPVNETTFLAWKAKFDAEMLKLNFELLKQQPDQAAGRRLTGRAMFESDQTLAESDLNFVEDLDQNQIEALLHNIEEVDLGDEDFEVDLVEGESTDEDDDDEELDISDDECDDEDEEEKKPAKGGGKQKR